MWPEKPPKFAASPTVPICRFGFGSCISWKGGHQDKLKCATKIITFKKLISSTRPAQYAMPALPEVYLREREGLSALIPGTRQTQKGSPWHLCNWGGLIGFPRKWLRLFFGNWSHWDSAFLGQHGPLCGSLLFVSVSALRIMGTFIEWWSLRAQHNLTRELIFLREKQR